MNFDITFFVCLIQCFAQVITFRDFVERDELWKDMPVPALVTHVFEYLEKFFIHKHKKNIGLISRPSRYPSQKCNSLNINLCSQKKVYHSNNDGCLESRFSTPFTSTSVNSILGLFLSINLFATIFTQLRSFLIALQPCKQSSKPFRELSKSG